MIVTAWFWVILTLFGLVIVLVVLGTCLYFRRRMESIVRDASSIADLSSQKQRLDSEIEQCMKSLDENREELRKLDGERQKQELIREELASLSSQVAKEEKKINEYRKEAKNLQNVISALSQDLERLESKEAGREIEREVAEGQLENAEEDRPLVKLRVVRKHNLRI